MYAGSGCSIEQCAQGSERASNTVLCMRISLLTPEHHLPTNKRIVQCNTTICLDMRSFWSVICTKVSGDPATSILTVINLFLNYPEERKQFVRNVGFSLSIITALYQGVTLSQLRIKSVSSCHCSRTWRTAPCQLSSFAVNAGPVLFSDNQPDALIIQIYSLIKLYMFRASSLPIIRSFLLYNRHW